ncbi:unnamed protein product [Urochloa humidicola]
MERLHEEEQSIGPDSFKAMAALRLIDDWRRAEKLFEEEEPELVDNQNGRLPYERGILDTALYSW